MASKRGLQALGIAVVLGAAPGLRYRLECERGFESAAVPQPTSLVAIQSRSLADPAPIRTESGDAAAALSSTDSGFAVEPRNPSAIRLDVPEAMLPELFVTLVGLSV